MANGKSDFFEEYILDYFLGDSTAIPKWEVMYLALTTDYVLDSDDGTSISEVSGEGYERIPIYLNSGFWVMPENSDGTYRSGERRNRDVITFLRAQEDWGLVRGFAICTDKTGGDILWHGTVYPGRYVETDEIIKFDVGDLIIRED